MATPNPWSTSATPWMMPTASTAPRPAAMAPVASMAPPPARPAPMSLPTSATLPQTQAYRAPTTERAEDFGAHLFGGANRRGFFGGGHYELDPRNFLMPQIDRMNARFDQAANMGLQQQQAARGGQDALTQALFAQLAGGPSVAQQQLQANTDQTMNNAYALAAAGGRNGLATKMAMDRAGAAQQEAVGQSAMLRAQEMAQTQGLLSQLLGQQREQDLGLFQSGAGGQAQLNAQQLQALMNREQLGLSAFTNQPGGVLSNITNMASSFLMPFLAKGGKVPGKAKKKGDDYANDTVPAVLSPGEIVLPRSVAMAKDAPEKAKAFVAALRKKEARKAA